MKTPKRITDTFCQVLLNNFQQYSQEQQQQEREVIELITYLVDRSLIPPTTIRKFAILETFAQLQQNSDWKKQKSSIT